MVRRWRSGLGAVAVSVATVVLIVLDVSDEDVRTWWVDHALTCATVTGLLVLMVTVLVVDQVGDLRQARSRSQAVGAQAAIVLAQARQSSRSVDAVLGGTGDRDDATGDVRNYLMVLLVSGPLLIETPRSRSFLEEAQRLGAHLTRLLGNETATAAVETVDQDPAQELADATQRLQAAARPLLDVLHPAQRTAVIGADDAACPVC